MDMKKSENDSVKITTINDGAEEPKISEQEYGELELLAPESSELVSSEQDISELDLLKEDSSDVLNLEQEIIQPVTLDSDPGHGIEAVTDETIQKDLCTEIKEEPKQKSEYSSLAKEISESASESVQRKIQDNKHGHVVNTETHDYKSELENVLKKLAKTERQLEKANNYNNELREELEKLSSELHTFRSSAKNRKDASTQVSFGDILSVTDQEMVCGNTAEDPVIIQDHVDDVGTLSAEKTEEEPKSIADTLRETAEAAIAQTGYVYDENSGLYYDYNTGYYYDAEKSLYYDPRTGTYFYYNQETGDYTFHSQVDLSYYTAQASNQHGNEDAQAVPKPHTSETPDVKKKVSSKRKGKFKEIKRLQTKEQDQRKPHRTKEGKQPKKKKRKRKSRLEKWQEICKTQVKKISEQEVNDDFDMESDTFLSSSQVGERSNDQPMPGSSKDSSDDSKKTSMDDLYKDMPVFDLACDDSLSCQGQSSNKSNNAVSRHSKSEDHVVINNSRSDSVVSNKSNLVNGDNQELMDASSEYSDSDEESGSLCTGESEMESGELTDSESEEDSVIELSSDDGDDNSAINNQDEEIATTWPPCIRVIVTDSDCLDIGSLYIVTVNGATVGRVGQGILIPDVSISKDHAFIGFDEDRKKYVIKDRGSQNGTFVNEQRISEAKCESDLIELNHGDTLQFGCTRLLLHIHSGTDTCDECEPGIVKANLEAQQPKEVVIVTKEEKKKHHREQMKLLKQKYGLKNAAYVDNMAAINNPAYNDKAGERRKTVGSDNPYQPNEIPASVDRPISEKNVGHKLLKKLGWSEGEGLGKDSSGIQEPVKANIRANQAAGLGSSTGSQRSLDDVAEIPKTQKWLQTQIRYLQTQSKNKQSTDSNSSKVQFVQGPTQLNS